MLDALVRPVRPLPLQRTEQLDRPCPGSVNASLRHQNGNTFLHVSGDFMRIDPEVDLPSRLVPPCRTAGSEIRGLPSRLPETR